jgi:hypothetical protein
LLGVKYIYHRKSDGRNVWAFPYWEYTQQGTMKQIYADNDYWIYEFTDSAPRTFLAPSYKTYTRESDIIGALFHPTFGRRDTIVLEKEPSIRPMEGTGSAIITSYTPNSVTISVTSDVPKMLFVSDTFDRGWNATIDGEKTEIYRANYTFRAIAVPAGRHIIRQYYFPLSLKAGILVHILSVVSGILVVLRLHAYEHRNR